MAGLLGLVCMEVSLVLANRVRMCAKSKVEETIEIPFTITAFARPIAGGGGGGGGGGTTIHSRGQITFNGDEVFVWDIRISGTATTYVSDFWNVHLMTDFYSGTDGIITSKQQDGISNIFSTGFDEGFNVGVYEHFDSIYIYDVPSIVSIGSVTLAKVSNQPNNEITVTGVFIV